MLVETGAARKSATLCYDKFVCLYISSDITISHKVTTEAVYIVRDVNS